MHRGADTGGVLDTRAREVGHHASVVGLSRRRCGGYHRQPGSLDLELSDLVEGAAPLISQSFGGLRTSPHRAIVEALESMKTRDEELLKTAREKAAAESGTEPGSASSVKYAVRLQRRSAAGFPKDAAVRALAALVPPQHTVSLGAPEVTILVEVFKSLCGVAVVPGYHAMHDFNLHAAAGKQVVPPPPKSKKK